MVFENSVPTTMYLVIINVHVAINEGCEEFDILKDYSNSLTNVSCLSEIPNILSNLTQSRDDIPGYSHDALSLFEYPLFLVLLLLDLDVGDGVTGSDDQSPLYRRHILLVL